MRVEKVKCIYCKKKIEKYLDYCNKCGRDIRSMWATETQTEIETPSASLPLFCPNPRCHAPYTTGELFCLRCSNDYGKNPPIPEKDFSANEVVSSSRCIYCPECGALNDNNDAFCDCGCNFRIKPRVAKPPATRAIFYCAVCNKKQVAVPDGICEECRQVEKKRDCICPECKKNKVKKYGEICMECVRKKPMRGIGEGFHIAK